MVPLISDAVSEPVERRLRVPEIARSDEVSQVSSSQFQSDPTQPSQTRPGQVLRGPVWSSLVRSAPPVQSGLVRSSQAQTSLERSDTVKPSRVGYRYSLVQSTRVRSGLFQGCLVWFVQVRTSHVPQVQYCQERSGSRVRSRPIRSHQI